MSEIDMEECLSLLRRADDMLMDGNEIALAAHLSLVIERLTLRLAQPAPSEIV